MKTIVALVDLSEAAFKVLKHAHQMAAAFKAKVILLHVVPPEPVVLDMGIASPTVMEAASPETVAADRAKLAEMQESLAKFGVESTTDQLTDGSADAVIAEITKLNADLVIVGTHRHGALYNLFVGSVASEMMKRMTFPLLLVPVE